MTRLLCSIYPASKVFCFMIEGLKSKNNRTRIECVENVEFMIEQCGIEVMCDSSQPDVFVALSIMS